MSEKPEGKSREIIDQLRTTAYSGNKGFRQTICGWVTRIRALWPECATGLSKDSCFLVICSSKASPAVKSPPSDP
jgi:hypothetical protein